MRPACRAAAAGSHDLGAARPSLAALAGGHGWLMRGGVVSARRLELAGSWPGQRWPAHGGVGPACRQELGASGPRRRWLAQGGGKGACQLGYGVSGVGLRWLGCGGVGVVLWLESRGGSGQRGVRRRRLPTRGHAVRSVTVSCRGYTRRTTDSIPPALGL